MRFKSDIYIFELENIKIKFIGIHMSISDDNVKKVLTHIFCTTFQIITPKDEYGFYESVCMVEFNRKIF